MLGHQTEDMASKRVFILGGSGLAGRTIARHLFDRTDADIVLAGRNVHEAQFQAQLIDPLGNRVMTRQFDAAGVAGDLEALAGVDLFVNASSAVEHAPALVSACIAQGVDWIDLQLDRRQARHLEANRHAIEARNLCFITQAGFHPGVPAALVRWCASHVDELQSAHAFGCLRPEGGYPPSSAMGELVAEFKDYSAHVYDAGEWRKVSMLSTKDMRTVEMAFGMGEAKTYPYDLKELETLPAQFPTMRDLSFSMAGTDPVTDYLVTPLMMIGANLGSWTYPALAKLIEWSTRTFTRPPFGVLVQCDATGYRDGALVNLRVALMHQDAYELTAVPVVSMIEQLLDGSARQVGLHRMGNVVAPERLFNDCKMMGLEFTSQIVPQ